MPRITPPPDPPGSAAPPGTSLICQATLAIKAALDSCRDANPIYMSTAEKREVLLQIPALATRLAELNYRVMACAEDVADAHGARNVGDYIAHQTRQRTARLPATRALPKSSIPSGASYKPRFATVESTLPSRLRLPRR